MTQKQQEELDYLKWFYQECDFGPAHEDVIQGYQDYYTKSTGKEVPKGYNTKEKDD